MKIIGITGGTGCGKTTLLREVQRRGGRIIDCDALYYELLETSASLRWDLRQAFPEAFSPEGVFQRKQLGARVFADEEAMARLNRIVFFHVGLAVERILEQEAENGRTLCAIDAINLLESGMGALCDVTVAVTAPPEIRCARIMARDGISEEYARNRIACQKPEEFYTSQCTYTARNDASLAEFEERSKILIDQIIKGDRTMSKELRKKLLYQPKNGYDLLTEAQEAEMNAYCERYKAFLDVSKTERECVVSAIRLAEEKGFTEYREGMPAEPGKKYYVNNRGKGIMLAVIGTESLAKGIHVAAAHTDAPRLDLKPNPLYEAEEMAYFKTHHYGGIRKYQWVTIPLELHGVVLRRDGSRVEIKIGDRPEDPQFIINDLLPHLGREQGKKPLNEAIPSESLNILIGGRPEPDDDGKDRVKLAVMRLLNERYGIIEEDFISAELEAVPAANARDIGFDRSFIAAYGHDDRVCAYAELEAILETGTPARTAVCIFADKEEIGSEGVSGMQSEAFEHFIGSLCDAQGVSLRECFANSLCISADVTAAYDPNFAEVYEYRNSSFVNRGIGLCKYTGSGGKGGSSDASAEVVGRVCRIFRENGVDWQMAELGKTDAGGGGTVAKYMARRNIDTIDAGVPVLSMHAPVEVVAKYDCYMTWQGMKAVFAER